ncbi:MAG: transporter substrate-binding domain-containing protein, partial [Sneathiella sp.]
MKKSFICCCLFPIALGISLAVSARTLVVGLPLLEPYVEWRNGEASGMHVDLIKAVFRQMGEDHIIRVMPVNRLAHEFMSGAIDVTVMANIEPILSRVAYLTEGSLSHGQMALLEPLYNPLKVKTSVLPINALIAAIRGISPKIKLLGKHQIIRVNSREQLLKMLFAGRVKYIIAEEAITSSFARQRNFPPLASVQPLDNQSFHAAFSKFSLDGDA